MPSGIFYGTRGPTDAKIMIVGESWGATEARQERPFVGESGFDLNRLLEEAGIDPKSIFFTNVISAQPRGNDMRLFFNKTGIARKERLPYWKGLFPSEQILEGVDALREQIRVVNPELIIGFGNYSLWALTDNSFNISDSEGWKVPAGIGRWRGSQLYTSDQFGTRKFLPTYHPAAGLRTYPWRYMIRHDLKSRVKLAFTPDGWKEPPYAFIVRPSIEDITQYLQDTLCRLDSGPTKVVLDLETRDYLIACVGLCTGPMSAISIPLMNVNRDRGFWCEADEFIIVKLLRKVLTHPNIRLTGQHLLYDVQYIIDQLFCRPTISSDTMIAHHLCWPGGGDPTNKDAKQQAQGIQQKALYNLSSLYCDHHYYWKDEGKFWLTGESEDSNWTYNCRDCVKTWEVDEVLMGLVKDFRLEEQYAFQLETANKFLLSMMIRGVKIDDEENQKQSGQLSSALDRYDENLGSLVPVGIAPVGTKNSKPWYRSPAKQAELFYDILGVREVIDKKKGTRTCGKDALPIIGLREPLLLPIVKRLETRRSIGVYFNTFIKAKRDNYSRLRCAYNITGTDTFRLSSSENIYDEGTNLQNIPGGKEVEGFDFPKIKKQFVPDVGYELAEFDLAGADAQVVAWEAGDEDLKAAFRKGLKLHLKNARDVYPELTGNMTDDEIKSTDHQGGVYHNMKRMVHATNYVGSAQTISEKVHMPLTYVQEFQERWFYLHPDIADWHMRVQKKLTGITCWRCESDTEMTGKELDEEDIRRVCANPLCKETLIGRCIGQKFGFRIVYFDRIREILPKAVAWGPQSTVAINCNKGALALINNLPWVEPLMQVHDSLIVQYPIKYSDRLSDIKDQLHSITVPYDDPLTIPWGVKASRKSWGDAEKVAW